MPELHVEIVRLADDTQPDIVECKLIDAHDREWTFVNKAAIFTADFLDPDDSFPQPGSIHCQQVGIWQDAQGRTGVTVDTEKPWPVAASTGETRFDVWPEQLDE